MTREAIVDNPIANNNPDYAPVYWNKRGKK